jgi:hypothetical protein
MYKTTIKNLTIHRRAFADDQTAVASIDELIADLTPKQEES